MKSFKIFNRRVGSFIAAGAMVLATLVPSLAAADTVTERSIALGNSVKNVAGVSYNIQFKAQHASTGAYVVDFCTTAAVNTTCTTPTGFNAASVGVTSGSNTVSSIDANTVEVVLATPVGVGGQVNDTLTNLHNPDGTGLTSGTFYARIYTYTDDTTNFGYAAADDLDNGGGGKTHLDDGGVAMTVTDGFGVTGRALETLTFCAARSDDTIGSGCTGTLHSPSLTLGTGGILDATLSTGVVKTQISTNAAGGAVVSLKSSATGCGGLVRAGATDNTAGCGIAPLTAAGSIGSGAAKFGVKLGNLGGASSTITKKAGSYDTTNYYMGYVSGDGSGVTGPYGDPIYKTYLTNADSNPGPISDGTADLTFGANIGALTPAGNYSATLNLIATGTF